MSIFKKIIGASSLLVLLTGCFGPSPAEEIHIVMESSVKLENSFSTKGESLGELEEREQVIYNKISKMNSDEINEIYTLANNAIELAEKRKNKIEIERKYILSAKKEFQKVYPLIEDIKDNTVHNIVIQLTDTMERRYETYDELFNSYIEGIENDIALYQLLQKENLTLAEFQEQVQKSNDSYKKVEEFNSKFNEETEEFNEFKKTFYEAAEIN